MQLRHTDHNHSGDRCGLVFLSFLFHGLAAGLPLALLLTSDTLRQGLVAGCAPCPSVPWMARPAPLLIVATAFQLLGAAPASALPVRWFPIRLSASLAGLVLLLLLLLLSVLASLGPAPRLALLLLLLLLSGLHSSALLGQAARLPALYPGAVLLGMSLSGVVAALLVCAEQEARLPPRMTLLYGLICVLAVHLAAFDIHFALPLNVFFQQEGNNPRAAAKARAGGLSWAHGHLFLSSLITATILPAVLHGMAPLAVSWRGSHHFSPLLGFANFHLAFSTGVFSAIFSLLPSPWLLALLTTVRLVLLPLLAFGNLLPETRLLPVLLTWDWTLILTVTLSGLLGGYLTAATFTRCLGRGGRRDSVAAMRSLVCLLLGSLAGAGLALLLPALLQIRLLPG